MAAISQSHTAGYTGVDPVSLSEESEPCTQSYWDSALTDTVDKIYKHAKKEKLAVVAYDVHKMDHGDGTFHCKVEAFGYHYILPL